MIEKRLLVAAGFCMLALAGCKKQDDAKIGSSSGAVNVSDAEQKSLAPGGQFNSAIKYSTFTDLRDEQIYNIVKIGDLVWMAQNINFKTNGSLCYNDEDSNCAIYGRLYSWDIAMKACPNGWRLPHHRDWENLAEATGGKYNTYSSNTYGGYVTHSWEGSGKKLKSKTGWKNGAGNDAGNGTDEFGFSALPDGREVSVIGSFGKWWTSLGYYDEHDDVWLARSLSMNWDSDDVYWGEHDEYKSAELSVRCVQGDAKAAYLSGFSNLEEFSIETVENSPEKLEYVGNVLEAWDNELSQISSLLKAKLEEPDFRKWRSEQEAWIKEKDSKAEEEAKNACVSADEEDLQELNNCTGHSLALQFSLLESTKARTLELVEMYFK